MGISTEEITEWGNINFSLCNNLFNEQNVKAFKLPLTFTYSFFWKPSEWYVIFTLPGKCGLFYTRLISNIFRLFCGEKRSCWGTLKLIPTLDFSEKFKGEIAIGFCFW